MKKLVIAAIAASLGLVTFTSQAYDGDDYHHDYHVEHWHGHHRLGFVWVEGHHIYRHHMRIWVPGHYERMAR